MQQQSNMTTPHYDSGHAYIFLVQNNKKQKQLKDLKTQMLFKILKPIYMMLNGSRNIFIKNSWTVKQPKVTTVFDSKATFVPTIGFANLQSQSKPIFLKSFLNETNQHMEEHSTIHVSLNVTLKQTQISRMPFATCSKIYPNMNIK